MSAAPNLKQTTPSNSFEATVFQRMWHSAVTPTAPLPPYEDIVLGSLGRLARNLMVVERLSSGMFKILIAGRGLLDWTNTDAAQKRIDQLPRDFSAPLQLVLARALESRLPVIQHARRVRGGMVETFELLGLPLSCRWGGTLLAVHVARIGTPFNLVDTIFRSTDEGILALTAVRDESGRPCDFQIVAFNSGAARLLGWQDAELQWSYISNIESALDMSVMRRHLLAALETNQHQQFELTVIRGNKGIHLSIGLASAGDLISITLTDVTEIREREESVRLLFDNNPVPMWLYDPDTLRLLGVNDAAISHYGYSRDRFSNMFLPDLWPINDEYDLHASMTPTVGHSYSLERTCRHVKADGSQIEVLTYERRVTFAGHQAVLVAVVDVTERKQAEARIAYLAKHDALTNLPNRLLFHEGLRDALARLGKTDRSLAIHCIDLDHFKSVNDTLGHPIGDQLLRAVAERLKHVAGGKGLVARLGGDEFAVIQNDLSHPNEANDLATTLIGALSSHYDIQGHEVVIGASIGIALAPNDGDTPDTLLRNADMALYRAKAEGRGAAHFFEPEMDRRVQARRLLELDLRKAFTTGEFEVHYQPLINLSDNQISGFEALLRWDHPTRGMVPPSEFIPLAEEIGLIGPMGEWVLRQACTEAVRWPKDLRIAVNLSPVQFRGRGIVQAVMTALAYSRLAPERLELEVTESVLLADTEANLATLHKLREVGVRISMDDFGTGYSSLSYLRSFPFDKIKIDRSFVSDLTQRPDCMAIIQAVIGLGASLGIATTAEGVETRDQLECLRSEGCTEAQGFLFSRPRPAADILGLISTHEPCAKVA